MKSVPGYGAAGYLFTNQLETKMLTFMTFITVNTTRGKCHRFWVFQELANINAISSTSCS